MKKSNLPGPGYYDYNTNGDGPKWKIGNERRDRNG